MTAPELGTAAKRAIAKLCKETRKNMGKPPKKDALDE
jgi:hypothetical protein